MPWTKVYLDKEQMEQTLKRDGLRGITYREAMLEAQRQCMEDDETVFILGEGVDDPGGIFGTTVGLVEQFGRDRVMDIPIAENGLTGIAIGAAAAGVKPVFIHMRVDFMPMCMDQIVNHAAKWNYMTGGTVNIPLVIRAIIGRGWGSAAQHSQALHALFAHIPGLKVVMPATPYDAKGLFISAIEDGNPVLILEHRWVFDAIGYCPEEKFTVPIGKGIIRRAGTDVTIVAISQMVYESMKAAAILAENGIDAEIVEPRTIKPLDAEIILESVAKTGRLIVADPACKTGSVGAEIVCRICEEAPETLKAPVKRICFPDTPTPCSPSLEEAYYPDAQDIVRAATEIVKRK